jgi:putative ABC transport system permease protein
MFASMRAFLWRLSNFLRRTKSEAALDGELEFHLQMEIEKNLRRGIPPEEARRQAFIALGGLDQTKEAYRETRAIRWLEEFIKDLRFGARMMKQNPGLAAMIVIVLALGIGANTAFFSILNTLFFRPLPYPDSERLVLLGEATLSQAQTGAVGRSCYATFVDWSSQNQVFEHLAAYQTNELNVAASGEARRIKGDRISADYFNVFRIQSKLGRTFVAEDFAPNRNQVAILSYQYWQNAFGGRSDILGKIIRIEEKPTTIVGVMPEHFRSLPTEGGAKFWIPLIPSKTEWARSYSVFSVIGRLKNSIKIDQARDRMTLIERQIAVQYSREYALRFYPPSFRKDWGVRIEGMHRSFVQKGTAAEGQLLAAAFGFFLLIVCANVANLLLAQGVDRRKEIGVRIALGAGRLRVVRQLMAQSVLLALLGGVGGLLLAKWSLPLFLRASGNLYAGLGIEKFKIDGRVLLFTLGISLASSLVFGIVPALTSTKVEPLETLKNFATGYSSGMRRRRLSGILVVSEFALSLVLLVSGGFFLWSLYQLWNFNWGFPLENRLAVILSLAGRSEAKDAKRNEFFGDLLSQVQVLPGVRSAALMMDLPIMWQGASTRIGTENSKGTNESGSILTASGHSVSPDYWKTLGIPLKMGRYFTEQDTSRDVAIVSERMAHEVWKGQSPIGKKVEIFNSWFTVIGVSADVINLGFARKPEYAVYLPSSFTEYGTASLVLHTSGDPMNLAPAVRDIIKQMDPDQPVTALRSLKQAQDELGEPWEFLIILLGSIAVMAVIVSAIGMYGVTSRSVAAQTKEIGIRMALGASSRTVVAQVVGHSARWAFAGIMLGMAGTLAAAKILRTQFWWLASSQIPVVGILASVLGIVALLACYLPARRASRIEPAIALRSE